MNIKHAKIWIILALKVLLSGGLVWLILSRVELSQALAHLSGVSIPVALGCALLILGTFMLASFRLVYVLKMFDIPLGIGLASKMSLTSAFFSQALITFLSGDAIRIWWLTRINVDLRQATGAILIDRSLGIIAITFLYVAMLPWFLDVVSDPVMRWSMITVGVGMTSMCLTFFILGGILPSHIRQHRFIGFVADIASASRYIHGQPSAFFVAFLMSLGIHIINTLVIFILAQEFGMEIGFYQVLMVVPIATLISMLPISVAGWGVRETVLIVAFGLFGQPSDTALAASIGFGLILLVSSLPGSVLWFRNRSPQPTTTEAGNGLDGRIGKI
jgi:uncharacterized membrane protein YbhN (UPF0104 family)